ncbi:hypothetical protein FACS1894187_25620 [Synergistales bacterium]|nr:hypothetical protein FACS1894187_25620 [Synergistales bacterium]
MSTSINKWARGKIRAVALTAALLFGLMLGVAPRNRQFREVRQFSV